MSVFRRLEFLDSFSANHLIQYAMELDFDFDYNTKPMGFWAFVGPLALASMVIGILVYLFAGFL